MRLPKINSILLGVATVLLFFFFVEIAARMIWSKKYFYPSERYLAYRYDAELGWFPRKNFHTTFQANRLINLHSNSEGFRDKPITSKEKPRLVFLGDSYTWGYDVEASERFSDRVQAALPNVDIMNLGVSGYGTDQEFLLLQKYFDRIQPDAVVLVFCVKNDFDDNSHNLVYEGYYKPYFQLDGANLQLHASVPRSMYYYRSEFPLLLKSRFVEVLLDTWTTRVLPKKIEMPDPTFVILAAMRDFLAGKGVEFSVLLTTPHQQLENFLAKERIPYQALKVSDRFPDFGNHWTPRGHGMAASQILAFMRKHKLAEIDRSKHIP